MKARRERLRFFSCLAAQGVLFVALSFAARSGAAPSRIVLGLALSFVPYAGLLAWAAGAGEGLQPREVALAGVRRGTRAVAELDSLALLEKKRV